MPLNCYFRLRNMSKYFIKYTDIIILDDQDDVDDVFYTIDVDDVFHIILF
jgi:hypothetical protein